MNEPSVASTLSASQADAFAGVIELYQAPIIRYLYRLSGNYEMSCELAQDTFVQAYLETPRNKFDGELKQLLYRLATDTAMPLLTRKKALPFIPFIRQDQPVWHVEEKPFELDTDRARLQKTLLTLPAEQRVCLLLHFVEGFSYQAISETLLIPPATVKTRICAGKHAFRENENPCAEMDGLLSAHADRELAGEEKSAVDRHVLGCAPCRAALRDYVLIREKLASLWTMPPTRDIRPATLVRIKEAKIPERRRAAAFPRLAAAFAAAAVLVLPLLITSDVPSNTQAVISRMEQAIKGVTSYRMTTSNAEKWPQTGYENVISTWDIEYGSDSDYRIEETITGISIPQTGQVVVVTGNVAYSTWPPDWPKNITISASFLAMARELYAPQIPEYAINVRRKPDENIDGVDCFHYGADFDMEKFTTVEMAAEKAAYQQAGIEYNEKTEKQLTTYWKNTVITMEFWIGKTDYLPRQKKTTYQPRSGTTLISSEVQVVVTKYRDFNQPVDIQPPLTPSGEMQDGWWTVTVK